MKRTSIILAVLVAIPLGWGQNENLELEDPPGYHLVNNFSGSLPAGVPFLNASVVNEDKQVGQASNRLDYEFSPTGAKYTVMQFKPGRFRVGSGGTLKFWLKGDGSANRLTFYFQHSRRNAQTAKLDNHQVLQGTQVVATLNATEWTELEFPIAAAPANRICWLHSLRVDRVDPDKLSGSVWLDDMVVVPPPGKSRPPTLANLVLVGDSPRDFSTDVSYNLDVRNFTDEAFRLSVRLMMVDSRDNQVLDRTFNMKVQGGEVQEHVLNLEPDNLQVYLPPFTLSSELFSPDRPELAVNAEEILVMATSHFLVDDFSDVHGKWFASGLQFSLADRSQMTAIFGEPQRAQPKAQLLASLSRVPVTAEEGQPKPPTDHAMQIGYLDNAMVYRRISRDLPGAPYALGTWVKGDGNGGELWAVIIDFSAPGGNFYNWKRTFG
ncbi:MAG: hypothetical protein VB997_11075, partial [Opitutales bacterium]